MASKLIDLTGQKFNRLTVISRASNIFTPKGLKKIRWLCLCDCGNTKIIQGNHIRTGDTKSCGCFKRESASARSKVHGKTGTVEFQCWVHLKQRCNNPRDQAYARYGGRGIKVCDRWLNSFENFYVDMGERPNDKSSIDRIDNDGDYAPENCRWASRREQANNTRRNHMITVDGETLNITQWAKKTGINAGTLFTRVYTTGTI